MKRAIIILMLMVGVAKGQSERELTDTRTLTAMGNWNMATNAIVTNVVVTAESQVKSLAKSGEICKVYGHQWEVGLLNYWNSETGLFDITDEDIQLCKICKATKTTKIVTEIKEAEVGDEN